MNINEFSDCIDLLELTKDNFESGFDIGKTRGHRYDYLLIPKKYEETYIDHPLFIALKGTLYIGNILKTKIAFY